MRCVEIQDFCGIALLERLDERFGVAHVLTDRFALIVVVCKGGVDIRQRDARKLRHNLIRRQPMPLMPYHNILHAETAAGNTRFPPTYPWGAHDVLDERRGNMYIV